MAGYWGVIGRQRKARELMKEKERKNERSSFITASVRRTAALRSNWYCVVLSELSPLSLSLLSPFRGCVRASQHLISNRDQHLCRFGSQNGEVGEGNECVFFLLLLPYLPLLCYQLPLFWNGSKWVSVARFCNCVFKNLSQQHAVYLFV